MFQDHHPLVGRRLPSPRTAPVTLRPVENCARFNFRIAPENLDAASAVWGSTISSTIGELATAGGRIALCIGPDEWFLVAPLDEQAAIEAAFASLYETVIHSLVDVGHREVGIVVEGPQAAAVLQSSIAAEVDAMPVGSGRRTIIDRVQIILMREAEDRFRVEVWHSFADHVWHLLAAVCREFESGL